MCATQQQINPGIAKLGTKLYLGPIPAVAVLAFGAKTSQAKSTRSYVSGLACSNFIGIGAWAPCRRHRHGSELHTAEMNRTTV